MVFSRNQMVEWLSNGVSFGKLCLNIFVLKNDNLKQLWAVLKLTKYQNFSRYTDLAKAETCFTNMISGVWAKPKRLGRSASYTNLTYIKG